MPSTMPLTGSTSTFEATAWAVSFRYRRSACASDFPALYLASMGQMGVQEVLPAHRSPR
jgi:hypothetical protein